MPTPYLQDQIENVVSDFCLSDSLRPFPQPLREIAADVLVQFLAAACAVRDGEIADIEEPDIKSALLTRLARLNIPADLHPQVPALVAALLAYLESSGRLSAGRALGSFATALAPAYRDASTGKPKPIVNPSSKLGRNDPCPCGSGKKYKKCCQRDA